MKNNAKQMPPDSKMGRPKPNVNIFKVLGRIIGMLLKAYPGLIILIAVCILISSVASAVPDIFIQKIVAIIEKWTVSGDWASACKEITPYIIFLVIMYIISLAAVTAYTQLGAIVTQGFLNKMRCKMFEKMQNLPIKFFDTNKHGDIMSYYTNDIDTLRQLISQSLPTILRAGTIVIAVLGIMLYFSFWMTIVLLVGVVLMFLVSTKVGGGSAKYFIRQQKSLGATEGYPGDDERPEGN